MEKIVISFDEFPQFIENNKNICANEGLIIYSECRAFINFDSIPELIIYVTKKTPFVKDDFDFIKGHFEIIGKSPKEFEGTLEQFVKDLKYNWFKILIIGVLFFVIFNPWTFEKEVLIEMAQILLTVVSIFVSMVFVFIGFFYGDKNRTIDVYKKGLCDKEFFTDRYILNLSFIAIVFLILSVLFEKSSFSAFFNLFLTEETLNIIIRIGVKHWVCLILVMISVVFLVICFDSLINYYLKTMRNKYLIDAVEEKISERQNLIKKNKI